MSYQIEKLKNIALIKTGKLDSNAAVTDGVYPFFTCDPITLKIDEWAYDTEAVLLAGNNASGNYTAKYYKGKFNAYQRTYIIESANISLLSVRFLAFAITQQLRLLKAMSTGSTTKFLTIKMLNDLEIPCPEISVQQKIASIIGSYDNLIENNQKQIKLLEEAAQRIYKEWFVDLRFPGHENIEILDGIPLGWYEDTIDTKVNLLNGFAFKSKDLEETGLFKLVTIKNVQDGYFESKNVKYLSKIPDKMPKHCYLDEGDLLLSLTGNVGRVCIVEGNDFLLNQRVAKISSETPAYTYCLFRSNELFIKINNIANGAAQQNVSPIRIGQIKHLFQMTN